MIRARTGHTIDRLSQRLLQALCEYVMRHRQGEPFGRGELRHGHAQHFTGGGVKDWAA